MERRRHTSTRAVRSVVAAFVLLILVAAGEPTHAAPGDAGSVLVRGSGPHSGTYPIRDVAVAADGRIWFSSADRLSGGQRLAGRVGRYTAGVAGSMQFFTHQYLRRPGNLARFGTSMFVIDKSTHSAFRIAGGQVTYVPLFTDPVNGGPEARSPDSALARGQYLWFTATNGARSSTQAGLIGRFRPANPEASLQTWRVAGLRDLQGLAMGPNNRLWMVGNGTPDDLGMGWALINPDAPNPGSTIRVFPVQGGDDYVSAPRALVRGPDNRMWFIANGNSRVGRINPLSGDPAATVELFGEACDGFPPPPCGGQLFDLTVGPDGAIWYTRSTADALGRVTVAGAVTSATPATAFNQPLGIVRSGDRLWVAVGGSQRLAWYEP